MVKFFACILFFGCISNAFAQLSFSNATVRLLPPGQKQTAAYVTISNSANQDITLAFANSSISQSVEFHQTMMHGEMMHMMQVEQLTIPANGKLELKPGGYHLMLINLSDTWFSQNTVQLEFFDVKNNSYKVTANLSKMAGGKHNHHHHH
ncbi:hypothetical protein DS2_03860 [Catenovulum agarivorans DS-2]|uniref:Copper chaperone PCu(A)C n=1 Tax=Catenovulum agarivorans DS-2 TaxID=1328313 RepID=W7QFD2_9ALTE|nr:copper chaperone PCu(A)C [Catenovulum agarivorans]EWH11614.1 hypothetical protein DS2_03860 [Catenovulum agarivorans DS-2]